MPSWLSKIIEWSPIALIVGIVAVLFGRRRRPTVNERHFEEAVRAEMKKRINEGATHDKEAIRRQVEADLAELDSVGDAGFLDRAREHARTGR